MASGTIASIAIKRTFFDYIVKKDFFPELKKELMKYNQHGSTSIYKHSRNVAYNAFLFAKKHKLNINYDELIEAIFCHDFFMYDWHEGGSDHRLHGFTHAHTAALNAKKYCNLNEHELSIIESHMWPLNITKVPKSKEAWLLCLADKKVALAETLHRR
jgi:uncharacterized protein